jgi:hypothetical protein
MKPGDLVKIKGFGDESFRVRGVGLVLRRRIGANAGTDRSVIEVMWPNINRFEWHAGCMLEVV